MPLFSIVIPAFNAASTLAETLDSVLMQSFGDWEAIVLDDASTDETRTIAAAYAARDPRIDVVSLAKVGPSAARNEGVARARGEWIAFLDADDLWVADKLARCAEAVGKDAPDAVYGRIVFFRGTAAAARTLSTVRARPLSALDLLCENPVCTLSNLVVRRAAFIATGGFDPSVVHGEDVEFMIRLVAGKEGRIESIDETLVYYRASDSGLSADLDAMRRGWRQAVATARTLGVPLGDRDLRTAEAIHLRYLARRALRVRSPRFTSLRLSRRGIALSPTAFFAEPKRGVLTLLAACAEPMLPAAARRFAFHR